GLSTVSSAVFSGKGSTAGELSTGRGVGSAGLISIFGFVSGGGGFLVGFKVFGREEHPHIKREQLIDRIKYLKYLLCFNFL
ncbi:MAG: hypothetical protein ACE5GI_02625, partial [Candidatus Aminicenantales bacterium]